MQEFLAGAVVEPDAVSDVLHVRPHRLVQISNLVDQGGLGREEGVGGVFDQLASAAADEQDRRFVEVERGGRRRASRSARSRGRCR